MNQIDEILKVMLSLERRIEKLEDIIIVKDRSLMETRKLLKECFGKIEGLL